MGFARILQEFEQLIFAKIAEDLPWQSPSQSRLQQTYKTMRLVSTFNLRKENLIFAELIDNLHCHSPTPTNKQKHTISETKMSKFNLRTNHGRFT